MSGQDSTSSPTAGLPAALHFVLLEHDLRDADGRPVAGAEAGVALLHWDFMVERAGADRLATWRLADNPLATTRAIPAMRIADHRREYLTYEGPVSRERGRVRRLDAGVVIASHWRPDEVLLQLAGSVMKGPFRISVTPTGEMLIRLADAPTT